jgi:anti-sigma factor RsiW
MTFYLDDELQGAERSALEAHIGECSECARLLEAERRFLEAVRGSSPLHLTPPEIRETVERLLSVELSRSDQSQNWRQRLQSTVAKVGSVLSRPLPSWSMAATIIIAAGLLLTLVLVQYHNKTNKVPSDFALMAVDTHQRHQRNQLPLEITSDRPEQISGWFAGKVPFRLTLPNYQESSGQEKLYTLEGARLVGYRNDYAAYVAYKMRSQPISLVVTSESVARPSGGEEIASRGLTFHYDSIQGLKVITWSDRGLTYALVSDLEERGQKSCIVCHQGTKDQDFIECLKPKQVSRLWSAPPSCDKLGMRDIGGALALAETNYSGVGYSSN